MDSVREQEAAPAKVSPVSPISQVSPRNLRDAALAAQLRDRLAHDQRTAHLALDIRLDGALAQVTGEVGAEAERLLLQRLLREQGGLYAVWDLLRLPGQQLAIADFGCGGHKQIPSALGVDCVAAPGVDVVTDLEQWLPFGDDTFDHIFAVHVVEHIHDLLGLMREMHRVLRPTGVLHVFAPQWRHPNAIADPTHVRFIHVRTFQYFCEAHPRVAPWRPLMVTASPDTVHADMQPLKDGTLADPTELARWFA